MRARDVRRSTWAIRGSLVPGASGDFSYSCEKCSCAAGSITAMSSTANYKQASSSDMTKHTHSMTPSLTTSLACLTLSQAFRDFLCNTRTGHLPK